MGSNASSMPSASKFNFAVLMWAREISRVFHRREAMEEMARHFNLSPKLRSRVTPIARQTDYELRTSRAISNLKSAGLLEWKEPGRYVITELGKREPASLDNEITVAYLRENYRAWQAGTTRSSAA